MFSWLQFDRRLRSEDIRALATMVHMYDAGTEGKVTFQELLVALRAVDCRSSKGLHARGFGTPPAAASGGGVTSDELGWVVCGCVRGVVWMIVQTSIYSCFGSRCC